MNVVGVFGARLFSAAVTLLYPARCASCDAPCEEDRAFCPLCAFGLEPVSSACALCALPLPSGTRCLACLRHPPIWTRADAPFQFGGAIAQAVRRFKWGRLPELGRPLGALLPPERLRDCDVVVPVPLHPRRLRSREFNQAALLALGARAAHHLPVPIDVRALARVKDTPPQSALGFADRRKNVRDAFLARPERVRRRRVLLVDDVLTTGATAEACARALYHAGADEVAVLTVARAVP
jgi:ComF family protein